VRCNFAKNKNLSGDKKMKIFAQKIIAAGVGVLLLTGVPVYGGILYNNSTTDLGHSLNFTNGQAIGNQVFMGNGYTSATLTNFSFEIYSSLASFAGTNVQMNVFLYANNGALTNGFAMPNQILYTSGLFTLPTPQSFTGGTNVGTVSFPGLSVSLPNNTFTLAAVVTGLASGDTVGMEVFDPPTVGNNYTDYWLQNGAGSWALMSNGVTSFGSQFQGTGVPEPSTLGLSIVGASLLIGSIWLRRRQNQSRQG
jgi:hypothetical protein